MPFPNLRVTPFSTDHTGPPPSRSGQWNDPRRMFESTAVISKKRGWRAVSLSLIPASLAAHVMVGVVIIAVQSWQVSFPSAAPATVAPYTLMVALAVPPPPPPPPPPAAAPVERIESVQQLPDNVAPTAIPDQIPVISLPQTPASDGSGGGVEGGVEGGEIGGVVGGTEGGVTPPGPPPPPPDTIVIARDEKLPLKPLSMTYPLYPDKWRFRRVEDVLVLRYRIDKQGRVVETIILQPPRYPEFAEASIKAVRSWRFRPLMVNGEPKEVLHELTVNFKIEKPMQRAPRAAREHPNRPPGTVPPQEPPRGPDGPRKPEPARRP